MGKYDLEDKETLIKAIVGKVSLLTQTERQELVIFLVHLEGHRDATELSPDTCLRLVIQRHQIP